MKPTRTPPEWQSSLLLYALQSISLARIFPNVDLTLGSEMENVNVNKPTLVTDGWFLFIFPVLQIQLVSGNTAMNGNGTRYNPAGSQ
ncbi:TPA: hypothetical protein U2L92_003782 [Enterobacter hormaechei]|nr:hypothetical protein [Enterobacter hormaechei]HEM8052212.1 hypothetical protein [Enterobacter hormaechei]